MIVSDLLEVKTNGLFTGDKTCCGRLIALDGKDGRRLFDTKTNKKEVIRKYKNGIVLSLWAEIVLNNGVFGNTAEPIMKCYVSHNSWESEEE